MEEQIPALLEEYHLQVEMLLEEESFLESFYLLKRMELLIDVRSSNPR